MSLPTLPFVSLSNIFILLLSAFFLPCSRLPGGLCGKLDRDSDLSPLSFQPLRGNPYSGDDDTSLSSTGLGSFAGKQFVPL
jgi:hypothetical protein